MKDTNKTKKNHEANEWCNQAGMPEFMYLPVPKVELNSQQNKSLEKHMKYWVETQDWDAEKQEGFWMFTYFYNNLPEQYKYLANRMMNSHCINLQETFEAIIGLLDDKDIDPYEEMKKKRQ